MAEWIDLVEFTTSAPPFPGAPPVTVQHGTYYLNRFTGRAGVPDYRWVHTNGYYAANSDSARPTRFKIGLPEKLALLRGKVLRAIEFDAYFTGGSRGQAAVSDTNFIGWPGFVLPDPERAGRDETAYQFEVDWAKAPDPFLRYNGTPPRHTYPYLVSIPDRGFPIGAFPDVPQWGSDQTNRSPTWEAGILTKGFIVHPVDTQTQEVERAPGIIVNRARVLVDDPPHVTVDVPSSAKPFEDFRVRVKLAYPSGEPVRNFPVSFYSPGDVANIQFRLPGTISWRTLFDTYTDEGGVVELEAYGAYEAVASILVGTHGFGTAYREMFEPHLIDASFPITIANPGSNVTEPCWTIPADPGQQYVPPRVDMSANAGWNAGAHSVKRLEGDVSLRFHMRKPSGVVLGLVSDRADPTDRTRITHGFIFTTGADALPRAQVYEAGKQLTSPVVYAEEETVFEVRRVGGQVNYYIDDEQVYSSRTPSSGEVSVGTSLYATGDEAPPFSGSPAPPSGQGNRTTSVATARSSL